MFLNACVDADGANSLRIIRRSCRKSGSLGSLHNTLCSCLASDVQLDLIDWNFQRADLFAGDIVNPSRRNNCLSPERRFRLSSTDRSAASPGRRLRPDRRRQRHQRVHDLAELVVDDRDKLDRPMADAVGCLLQLNPATSARNRTV